jgi:hypothetical protein
METQLNIIGIVLVLLAAVHVVFPTYFDWKNELNKLSLINKQMVQVHTFFIALTVLLMGVLCITSATEITQTVLGKRIALGFGVFWGCRLVIQFFGYSALLWRGKILETTIHILFSVLWMYLTILFFTIYIK